MWAGRRRKTRHSLSAGEAFWPQQSALCQLLPGQPAHPAAHQIARQIGREPARESTKPVKRAPGRVNGLVHNTLCVVKESHNNFVGLRNTTPVMCDVIGQI
jgi:hypothetical protein